MSRVSRDLRTRTKLTSIAYADDIVLFAQRTIVEHHSAALGLNVGPEKTARVIISADSNPLRTLGGLEVPIVRSYKYLGVTMATIDLRCRKCWSYDPSQTYGLLLYRHEEEALFRIVSSLWIYGECSHNDRALQLPAGNNLWSDVCAWMTRRGCCLQAVAVLCRFVALRCPPWPRTRLNVA